jgi:hypothetical protein
LLRIFFDHEDEGDMFLRNVSWLPESELLCDWRLTANQSILETNSWDSQSFFFLATEPLQFIGTRTRDLPACSIVPQPP